MRVTRIRAADFRNLPFADVDTDAPRVFLLGENGQGKTNLLEAAALVSAFRSFRTTEISPLIRMGCRVEPIQPSWRDDGIGVEQHHVICGGVPHAAVHRADKAEVLHVFQIDDLAGLAELDRGRSRGRRRGRWGCAHRDKSQSC